MNMQELTNKLIKLKQSDFNFEDYDLEKLVSGMLQYLGSPDPVLRDQLIYTTFFKLISNGHLDSKILHNMLLNLIGENYLLKGVGLEEDDSVFTRTFSSLIIALILNSDNKNNFLSDGEIIKVKNRLLDYFIKEQDYRGFVEMKGWAHSVAHAADAIDELIQSPKLPLVCFDEILQIIRGKVLQGRMAYQDDEDERLMIAIMSMLKRGYLQDSLITVIDEIPTILKISKQELVNKEYWTSYWNAKVFVRSLYFSAKSNGEMVKIVSCAERVLDNISRY
ncbi:MAG: hypothetical protein K0R18_1840 [Bacillales bacterium]|jgi:hypothetical protein|nr:hypothetical protein [Bacillales bacterium]